MGGSDDEDDEEDILHTVTGLCFISGSSVFCS